MIVCPLCEHPQPQGDECEACGKVLVAAGVAAEVPVQRLAELQETVVEGGPAARVAPVQPMTELEATRIRTGPDLPAAPMTDLELGRLAPVGEVKVEAVPELDRARVQDLDPRTALPIGAVTCRYCRNVQAVGLVCDKCGMRLPKAPVAAAAEGPLAAVVWTRCKSCGAKARANLPCGDCGRPVPMPDGE